RPLLGRAAARHGRRCGFAREAGATGTGRAVAAAAGVSCRGPEPLVVGGRGSPDRRPAAASGRHRSAAGSAAQVEVGARRPRALAAGGPQRSLPLVGSDARRAADAEQVREALTVAAPRSAPGRTRVLHVIQNLNYGGMERLLADLVRRIDRTRFESRVLVLQYFGRFADGLGDVATLHRAPPMSKGSMIWPRALARRIRAIRPDVVHTHSGVWYKASLAARLAGVPLVVHTEHGRQSPDPWLARWVDGLASRRTDVVVAVSGSVAEQLRARVVRRGCRVEVVENGVDTDLHAPLADTGRIRRELGIATDVPILGSIGRLERIKGYDVMIEAFARLHALWPPSAVRPALVLAGEGSERPKLEALAATLGIREHVRFLGW